MLSRTDVVLAGMDDLHGLFGFDEGAAHAFLRAAGPSEVVLKLPSLDCRVALADGDWLVGPEPVAEIVDTTAAGDSFAAAYLAARLSGSGAQFVGERRTPPGRAGDPPSRCHHPARRRDDLVTRRNLLTDIPGLAVGHATDPILGSGVTAIVFDGPCVVSACVLGGAPGTRDTAGIEPGSSIERIDAVVLGGGSAFGLDAAGGVQAALRQAGRGSHLRGSARAPGGAGDPVRPCQRCRQGLGVVFALSRPRPCGGHRRGVRHLCARHGRCRNRSRDRHLQGRHRLGQRRDTGRPHRRGDCRRQRDGLGHDRAGAAFLGGAVRAGRRVRRSRLACDHHAGRSRLSHQAPRRNAGHDHRPGRHGCRADQGAGTAPGDHGA